MIVTATQGAALSDSANGTGESGECEKKRCPVCGSLFVPQSPNARYCPPTDEERQRAQGQPRSRCSRRAMNHAQRLREGAETIALDAPLPAPYECAQCGKRCQPGKNVPPQAKKFCGRLCKRNWHRHPRGKPPKSSATGPGRAAARDVYGSGAPAPSRAQGGEIDR
jgi:hypothetical protein